MTAPTASAAWGPFSPVVAIVEDGYHAATAAATRAVNEEVCPHVAGTWGYPRAVIPLPSPGCRYPWCESVEDVSIGVLCFAETAEGSLTFCELYVPAVPWRWEVVSGVVLRARCVNALGDTTFVGGECVPGRALQISCAHEPATPTSYNAPPACVVFSQFGCLSYNPSGCGGAIDAACAQDDDAFCYLYAEDAAGSGCVGPSDAEVGPRTCTDDVELACWSPAGMNKFCYVWVADARLCIDPLDELPGEDP